MAINPNTDFTAGAVLTADQQNRFGRGIMQYVEATGNQTITASETATLTTPAFTAVAGRLYKISYFEPWYRTNGAVEYQAKIRLTDASGTILVQSFFNTRQNDDWGRIYVTFVGTLTAGSTVIVATGLSSNANNVLQGSSVFRRSLLVEDIGTA